MRCSSEQEQGFKKGGPRNEAWRPGPRLVAQVWGKLEKVECLHCSWEKVQWFSLVFFGGCENEAWRDVRNPGSSSIVSALLVA